MVANTEWPLPDNLLRDIKAERMTMSLMDMAKPDVLEKEDLVGWAECVGYLMPATSKYPLKGEVSNIYLYCVKKYCEQKKTGMTKEIKEIELSDNEKRKLKEYKLWIYESRGGKEQNPILNTFQQVFFNK